MRTLMKVLKNLFGNNTKISANDIAIKNLNNKSMSLDNYLKKTTLYDNSDGTNANFTLTDSASNYEYLEIFFGYGKNGNFGNSSVKLFYEYQQSANLILGIYDGISAQQMMPTVDVNNRSVSIRKCGLVDLVTHDKYTISYIKIYKVVGYK